MHLLPHEVDKLLLVHAGRLAQSRLSRGLRLNHLESIALISLVLHELIRDANHTAAQLMSLGRTVLGKRDVMHGVDAMIDDVQVEGTFRDGTKLVTVHEPIVAQRGDMKLALYGSGLPEPDDDTFESKSRQLLPGYQDVSPAAQREEEAAAAATTPSTTKKRKLPDTSASTSAAASSSLSTISTSPFPLAHLPGDLIPSPLTAAHTLNSSSHSLPLTILNHSDRPIQVGSHYHLSDVNSALELDRRQALGRRLNVPAGTAVRFEPGERKTVQTVPIRGRRRVTGGNRIGQGNVGDEGHEQQVMARIAERGFRHTPAAAATPHPATAVTIPRSKYMAMYGPTTGDRIHLADTGLVAEVEWDFITRDELYGDECVFGGGKTIREGMGQSNTAAVGAMLDLVICNAVVIDWRGIYKADIGVRGGLIVGIGKAGNSDVMDGVGDGMEVGVNTEVINAAGMIVTAGAIDTHIHFICPQLCDVALASGVTTMVGGGTGPTSGTSATTCTPSPHDIAMMLQATDGIAVNIGLTGKGNSSEPLALEAQVAAGVIGLKLHEDWGSTPSAIDCCLSVADRYDVQVTIHTDTLNESCNVEQTVAAIGGRTIHAYHSEGAGGGHAPDIITVCSHPNIIPSSTNPTRPFTVNTVDEHMDMLMVCHHLSRDLAEDVAFAESRIRGETIAAEDVLHDVGAISVMSSDSQAMGRVGEVVMRTWQTAAKMKGQRGHLIEEKTPDPPLYPTSRFSPPSAIAATSTSSSSSTAAASTPTPPPHDNYRIRRYVSKYTVNPALAHGLSHVVGSVAAGQLADLVLWRPQLFGSRPELVVKGGVVVGTVMGDGNASIPTVQPRLWRPMFGATWSSGAARVFVSGESVANGVVGGYGLKKRVEVVRGCRNIGKKDMKLNASMPHITVDPETFEVRADGELVTCQPADVLPLAQRYALF